MTTIICQNCNSEIKIVIGIKKCKKCGKDDSIKRHLEYVDYFENPLNKKCNSCKSLAWLISYGLGLQCKDERNFQSGKRFQIPSRAHSCNYWQMEEKYENSN